MPAWFHPPMALPSLTKQEIVDDWSKEENISSDPGDKEPGVTPPLMSPSGVISPIPQAPATAPVDPRHILHLLARKVRKLFAEISSNG